MVKYWLIAVLYLRQPAAKLLHAILPDASEILNGTTLPATEQAGISILVIKLFGAVTIMPNYL
jgi:hypothetical protein